MQVVGWSAARLKTFESVRHWLANYPEGTQCRYCWHLEKFMAWLSMQEEFRDATPDLLVQAQKLSWSSSDSDAKYRTVDVLAKFLREGSSLKRKSSRLQAFSIVRGFFAANRAPLPEDRSVRILGLGPLTSKLTLEDLRNIVMAANLRDRSWLLVKSLGFMGWRELEHMNLRCVDQVMKQMKRDVIRVDIPQGRKRNEMPYYTLFGGIAREYLKRYIDEVRGSVRPGEAIWVTKYGEPMVGTCFSAAWQRLLKRVGLVSTKTVRDGGRHGYGGHDTRDIARSLWHRSKADRECVLFFMGHGKKIDPNKYDRIYKDDPGWVEDEYRLALPHIDILNQQERIPADIQERVRKLQADFDELKRKFEAKQSSR